MVVAQEIIEWQQPSSPKAVRKNPRPTRNKKRFAKGKAILVLACIVGFAGIVGVETIQLTVVQGDKVRSLEKEISTIEAQNDLLQMEADKLRAVPRIESVAISMGMVKPAGTVYVANLPAVNDQKGASTTQVATQPTNAKPTALNQLSQIFTSFFASTQR